MVWWEEFVRGPGVPLIALFLGLWPVASRGTDATTRPFRGVTRLHRSISGSLNLNVVKVDLCEPGLSVRATMSAERRQTVSSFGRSVGAVAAVNADFFAWATYKPSGLAYGNGQRWTDTRNDGFESSIAFGPHHAEVLDPPSARNPASWVTELVSSRPLILSGGVVQHGFSTRECAGSVNAQGDCTRDPRTGIGLSRDRRTLVLAVVDGRQSGFSRGMTTAELASVMKAQGAWDAVNMDSGGSAQLWIKGLGIVNRPSDGSERAVANHLAVIVGGTGEPAVHCPEAPDAGVTAPGEDGGTPHGGGPGELPDGALPQTDASTDEPPDAATEDPPDAAEQEPDAGESDFTPDAGEEGLEDPFGDEAAPEQGCDCDALGGKGYGARGAHDPASACARVIRAPSSRRAGGPRRTRPRSDGRVVRRARDRRTTRAVRARALRRPPRRRSNPSPSAGPRCLNSASRPRTGEGRCDASDPRPRDTPRAR